MNTLAKQTIQIPEALESFPIADCRFRRRIQKALANYKLLGELQGLKYDSLFDLDTPEGERSALSLANRLDALAQDAKERKTDWTKALSGKRASRTVDDVPMVGGPQPDALDWFMLDDLLKAAPAELDDLEVRLIPHATCINAFLSRNKIKTIGDLKAFDFTRSNWGLGRLKLNSLIDLVRRAQDENRQADVTSASEAACLIVKTVDTFMKLPDREDANRMLRLRMCGEAEGDKPWTLERIGQSFKLTRERIRQIIDENQFPGLASFGGVRFNKALLRLGEACEKPLLPLTEARFAKWLGNTARDYPLPFYLALAETLAPADTLPVWVETPFYNYGNSQKVCQARRRLKSLRIKSGTPLTFDEVFAQLRRRLPSLTKKVFFAALFNNPLFEVDAEAGTLTRLASQSGTRPRAVSRPPARCAPAGRCGCG
jgi:hypothetical protein